MHTLLDAADREAILRRLAALTPTSQRQWGRFSMGGMLCHLQESTRMALGELPVRPTGKRAFQVFPAQAPLAVCGSVSQRCAHGAGASPGGAKR